ncbi:MAG: hypothetical protein AAFX06_03565 [Planctomycetota bacterium]
MMNNDSAFNSWDDNMAKSKKGSRPNMNPITKSDVDEAQAKWAAAIVAIGQAFTNGTNVKEVAEDQIAELYGYADGPVLFKPTKCKVRQFRATPAGALSYFVGNDYAPAGFPEDQGFAIAPFISVRFHNVDIVTGAGRAIAMGNYFFETTEGATVKVEYTFGYRRGAKGIVIDVHHSSLPYDPKPDCECE